MENGIVKNASMRMTQTFKCARFVKHQWVKVILTYSLKTRPKPQDSGSKIPPVHLTTQIINPLLKEAILLLARVEKKDPIDRRKIWTQIIKMDRPLIRSSFRFKLTILKWIVKTTGVVPRWWSHFVISELHVNEFMINARFEIISD